MGWKVNLVKIKKATLCSGFFLFNELLDFFKCFELSKMGLL